MQQPLQFDLTAGTAAYPPVLMPPWANGDGAAVDYHCTMQPMYMSAEDQRYMMVVPPAYQVPTPRPPPATSSNSSSHWSSKVRIPFSPPVPTPLSFAPLSLLAGTRLNFGCNIWVHRLLHFRMRAGLCHLTAHVQGSLFCPASNLSLTASDYPFFHNRHRSKGLCLVRLGR